MSLGLVEYDAAYQTWLNQQIGIVWPWSWFGSTTPQHAARFRTREFWFFSRYLNAQRAVGDLELDQIPGPWQGLEPQLLTGRLGDVDLSQGLLTLGQMLCAGSVRPPWVLGLSLNDFTDSYAMDMGYVDAFRLWIMSAFDDDLLLRKMMKATSISDEWQDWVFAQARLS